jgi:selenocysteine-specific elongation factor
MRALTERADLIKLDERTWIHQRALASARDKALQMFRRLPKFSTMEYRDALGVSRKYAVPILDYLDRTRFTVRSGHDRTPGVEARKLLG